MKSARFAPEIHVDRGNPVIVTIAFIDGDPDDIYFSYTKPGSERPYVDDGYGQETSRIERVSEGVYRYTINTRGFGPGLGNWHFSGEWSTVTKNRPYEEASIFGVYYVTEAPAQLL